MVFLSLVVIAWLKIETALGEKAVILPYSLNMCFGTIDTLIIE